MNTGHPNASNYIDGMLVHWYMGAMIPTSYLEEAHNRHPNKFMFNSESTISKKLIFIEFLWFFISNMCRMFVHTHSWFTAFRLMDRC